MSLTHVIPPEASPTLGRLHYGRLLENVDSSLRYSAFNFDLKLPRTDGNDKIENVVPRVHISRLDYLYKSLEEDFKSCDCVTISDLYSAGLGLPKDRRLSAYWKCFSTFTQPVQDGNVITLDDLMHVLEAHINQAKRDSWGGRYAYQQSVNEHYESFSRYSFKGKLKEAIVAAKERGSKKGYLMTRPKDSREGFVVYKHREGKYRLYGAWVESDNKFAPFIRQVMDSEIPSDISETCLKHFGTYLIVPGYFTFKKSVKDIMLDVASVSDVWDDCLEQDLFSHSDFKPLEPQEVRDAKKFVKKYREKYGLAKAFIEKHKKPKTRRLRETKEKATALVERFEKEQEIDKSFRNENRAWDTLNPAKHLTFHGYDMFFEDPITGFRQVKTEFDNILTKLKQCGIKPMKAETVKISKKLKTQLGKRDLVRIANNTAPIDIHDLWFGG